MGKRKSSSKAAPKKKMEPLGTTFKCLFCHHDKAVSVKLDKSSMFGHLACKTCGQKYTAPINNLSAAIDVYCDWVDACEEARLRQPKKVRAPQGPDPLQHGAQGGATLSFDSRKDHRDDDDEHGDDDDPEDAPASKRNGAPRTTGHDYDDDEDDEEDDEDDLPRLSDMRGNDKRARVADPDDDEDDD